MSFLNLASSKFLFSFVKYILIINQKSSSQVLCCQKMTEEFVTGLQGSNIDECCAKKNFL